jgi:hypothetical protein
MPTSPVTGWSLLTSFPRFMEKHRTQHLDGAKIYLSPIEQPIEKGRTYRSPTGDLP